MNMAKEKERIVALQRQLKIARDALTRIRFNDSRACSLAESAIEAMERIEWASKPNLVQGNP